MGHPRREPEVLAARDHDPPHVGLAAVGVHDVVRCECPQVPACPLLEVVAEFRREDCRGRGEPGLCRREVERGVVRLQLDLESRTAEPDLGRRRDRRRSSAGPRRRSPARWWSHRRRSTAVATRIEGVPVRTRDGDHVGLGGVEEHRQVDRGVSLEESLSDAGEVAAHQRVVPPQGDGVAADAEQHRAFTGTFGRLDDQYADSRVDEVRVPSRSAVEEDVDRARPRTDLAGDRMGDGFEADLDEGGDEELGVPGDPGRVGGAVRQRPRMGVRRTDTDLMRSEPRGGDDGGDDRTGHLVRDRDEIRGDQQQRLVIGPGDPGAVNRGLEVERLGEDLVEDSLARGGPLPEAALHHRPGRRDVDSSSFRHEQPRGATLRSTMGADTADRGTNMTSKPVTDWTTDYDILDPDYVADPYPVWDDLREQCPIAHTDRWGGSWLPTRYADVTAHRPRPPRTSARATSASSASPTKSAHRRRSTSRCPPIDADQPVHTWTRRLLLPWFSHNRVAQYEPIHPRAVQPTDRRVHRRRAGRRGRRLRPADPGARDRAHPRRPRATWPTRSPAGCSDVLEFAHDQARSSRGHATTSSPTCSAARATAAATPATTSSAICCTPRSRASRSPTCTMHGHGGAHADRRRRHHVVEHRLVDVAPGHPSRRRRRAWSPNPSSCRLAIEELLRAYSPVTMARIAVEDIEVAGCPMKAGDKVLMNFPAANRDPEVVRPPRRRDHRSGRTTATSRSASASIGVPAPTWPAWSCGSPIEEWIKRIP